MTKTSSTTFGWVHGDLENCAEQLSRALGIELEPRDSLYRGEYYNWRGEGRAHVLLQENFIEQDDGLRTDDRFPDHAVLLYSTDLPPAWLERIDRLEGVDRLRGE